LIPEEKAKLLPNVAPTVAVLFVAFTQAGNGLAADLFMRAHENLTACLTDV
jgi:hypothetical protein